MEVIVMETANVQIRMDAALKKEAEEMLKSMGLTMSAAVTLYFRQVVNQRRIPFEIVAPDVPNAATKKAMADAEKGKNLSRSFDTVDEMWKDLNA